MVMATMAKKIELEFECPCGRYPRRTFALSDLTLDEKGCAEVEIECECGRSIRRVINSREI
jgi:hypothetical protein